MISCILGFVTNWNSPRRSGVTPNACAAVSHQGPFLESEGQQLRQQQRQIRLIDRAGRADQVAQVLGWRARSSGRSGRASSRPASRQQRISQRGDVKW